MDELRRSHNLYKAELINRCVRRGDFVLDCGCGRGGDFGKWKRVGVTLTGVDPDASSLREATRRAETYRLSANLIRGDIRNVKGVFDAVCYNFSIHYIRNTLSESAQAIAQRVKSGGILFGIVPDSDRMSTMTDRLGNSVRIFDNQAEIRLVDGPFYAGNTRTEPLMNREILEGALEEWFECLEWEPMCESTGLVSDIYSRFIFRRK